MVEVSEVLNMYKLYSCVQPFFGPLMGTRDANTGQQSISLKGVYVHPSVLEVGEPSRLFLAIALNRALLFLFVWFPLSRPWKACSGPTTIMGRFLGSRCNSSNNIAISFTTSLRYGFEITAFRSIDGHLWCHCKRLDVAADNDRVVAAIRCRLRIVFWCGKR